MKLLTRLVLFSLTALFVSVGAAMADTSQLLYFNLIGPANLQVTFELSSKPVIAPGNSDPGCGFTVTPINLTIDGAASSDFLSFYNQGCGGAFAAFSDDNTSDFSLYGATLFGGSVYHPTFAPTAPLGDSMTDGTNDGAMYTLTISPVATPEPSSLLLLGMVLLPLSIAAKRFL